MARSDTLSGNGSEWLVGSVGRALYIGPGPTRPLRFVRLVVRAIATNGPIVAASLATPPPLSFAGSQPSSGLSSCGGSPAVAEAPIRGQGGYTTDVLDMDVGCALRL